MGEWVCDPLTNEAFEKAVPWQRFASPGNRQRFHRVRRAEMGQLLSEKDRQVKAMAAAVEALRRQLTAAGLKPVA